MSGSPLDGNVFQQRWNSLSVDRTVESTVRSENSVDIGFWSGVLSKALGLCIVPVTTKILMFMILVICIFLSCR